MCGYRQLSLCEIDSLTAAGNLVAGGFIRTVAQFAGEEVAAAAE